MARMIKYPTLCAYCNKMIAKGKGYLQRVSGKVGGSNVFG